MFKNCTKLQSYEVHGGFARFLTDTAEVRVYFLTDDIIRIRASFDKKFNEESYLLTMTAWEDRLDTLLQEERKRVTPVSPLVKEGQGQIIFSTKSVDLVLDKDPFAFSLLDKSGTVVYAELAGKSYMQDSLGRVYHYKKMKPTDCYYGFGEKTGEMDKKGRYMRFSPKDNIGYNPKTGDPLYKHIPVYIHLDTQAQHAMGIFYHNTCPSAMSMGDEISGYWPRYSYFVADGGDIDYFLINGPKISDVVSRYTDLTGKTVMQPRYSLGYLGSTMYYVELPENCDDEIVAFVDNAHAQEIPIDVFMLSSGYTTGPDSKRNVFTWNKERFRNPKDFFARMNERGVMVSPNVKPGILEGHPHYAEIERQGCFIRTPDGEKTQTVRWWGGPGGYFDFTSPKARRVWADYLRGQLMEMGTTSIWNDNCEYDGIDNSDAQCDFEGAKGTHGTLKAVQSTLMSYTSHIAAKEHDPDVRPYVVCRSGSAGIQRYAQTWSGDNTTSFETLKYNIATILGLGLSGNANTGSDIGGFQGPAPGAELLVRWVQNGIFQPRFSIHSCNSDNTVTEPWMYGEHTVYIRDAIKLRYQMVPYLYALLRQANTKGSPIMRPMVYEFQNDPDCYQEGVDFMLGPYILVANVVDEGAKTRSVYLPKGNDWYDFYTRTPYAGGQTITFPVDISSIPMFLREGAIVPLTDGVKCIQKEPADFLRLIITPKEEAVFTLYEDDGKTNRYKEGAFLETTVKVSPGEKVMVDFQKTGVYPGDVQTMLLDVVKREKGPYWVSVGEEQLKQYLHREKWEAAAEGWYYSQTLKSVQVKYKERQGDYRVTISFEAFDLIGM